ncbi:unnamed protein product [Rotaria sp. Silwood1]|nr:unnamed protein product [Rotaria sp. Silwood1]CAF1508448.1 unnamed protein product [Rotaria sp. Silwood1]
MSVFTRARNGLFGQTKPRNPHSIENLKYLYGVLNRNSIVSDANRDLLIETLRCISEILIWGDQNDSSVFDYFLERGMLTYFLNYMRQKHGRYICVQVLQTLNILFENIRHETSLYYLLSNNHINNIIVHKFDFTDEEITAYYISFLKTLSLKLNTHSINFFYNERNNDFPLYVEAIKFFNHTETMVRIAVRTLTLNVYKVPDPAMHRFILNRTATEYFSNLIWFIRSHILDFDNLIRNNQDINNRGRLTCSLEEYLDHIHYLQDIFLLNVDSLNNVLKDQLMNRLLIPIYIFSLIKCDKFSRITVKELADIILSANIETAEAIQRRYGEQISYSLPPTSLDVCLAKTESIHNKTTSEISLNALDIVNDTYRYRHDHEQIRIRSASSSPRPSSINQRLIESNAKSTCLYVSNWTNDEKNKRRLSQIKFNDTNLSERPYFEALIKALDCTENDQLCFYALSVLLTMTMNLSVDNVILESIGLTVKSSNKSFYNTVLVEQLCEILLLSTSQDSKIRLVTLNLAINLLKKLVYNEEEKISYLSDHHLARIEQVYEQSTENLRRHYRQQEMFLDLFEDEYRQMQLNPIRLEYLLKDAYMLYPPTSTPLTGVEFIIRLPLGDIERARRSIRGFFLIRALSLELRSIIEIDLPLIKADSLVKENDKLDLNNSDLIACTIYIKDKKERRFLVTDPMQFILIEPDVKILGWGIVKFCDLMQDVKVANDKEDTRSLHITIHKPVNNTYVKSNPPILNAKFTFDDHIRCMTAKQNLKLVK